MSAKSFIKPFTFVPAGKIYGANMLFHRRVIDKIGLFDVVLGVGTFFSGEDIDYIGRASWAGFAGAHIPELIIYHHHGRKPGEDVEKLREFYDYGRGAYYIKFILKGKFSYLKNWYKITKNVKHHSFRRELKGALRYLLAKIKNFLIKR